MSRLSEGARIAWGGDAFRAPSHGTIVRIHPDPDRTALYEVETWDGYVFGVWHSEISEVIH